MTALTVYLASAASTTLTTANQLYSTSGSPSVSSSSSTTIGKNTGWGEFYSQGNSSWASGGSAPSPSGHGFLWESTALEGQYVNANSWSGTIKMAGTVAGFSAAVSVHVRLYRRSSSGTYTLLADSNAGLVFFSGTATQTVTLSATTGTPLSFSTGDKLYLDIVGNISSGSLSNSYAVKILNLSNDTTTKTGSSSAQVVTPGYGTLATKDITGRLSVVAQNLRDFSLRTRFRATHVADTSMRLPLVATSLWDIAARLFLLDPLRTSELLARLQVRAQHVQETFARLNVQGQRLANSASRLSLQATSSSDSQSRLPLSATALHLFFLRVLLLAHVLSQVPLRLRLVSFSSGGVASRLTLWGNAIRDASVRLRFSSGASFANLALRFPLSMHYMREVSARLRFDALTLPSVRSRLSLSASLAADLLLRLRVQGRQQPWTMLRLLLQGQVWLSLPTRFLLLSQRFSSFSQRLHLLAVRRQDLASRLRLHVLALSNVLGRFRLQAVSVSSLPARMVLNLVRDIAGRVRLASQRRREVGARLTHAGQQTSFLLARVLIQAGITRNVPGRIVLVSQTLALLVLRVPLAAQLLVEVTSRLRMLAVTTRDVAGRLLITSSAVTAYFSSTASSTLSTSNQIYTTSGTPSTLTRSTTVGQSATGWSEIYSQGTTNVWSGGASAPPPSGHGWLWDVTTLEGQAFSASNWSGTVTLAANSSSTSMTGVFHLRAYKRSSSGTYTLIVESASDSTTLLTSPSTISFPATSGTATSFTTGDKLYIDLLGNLSSGPGVAGSIKLQGLSADTTGKMGNSGEQMVTPGYIPAPIARMLPGRLWLVGQSLLDLSGRFALQSVRSLSAQVRMHVQGLIGTSLVTRTRLRAIDASSFVTRVVAAATHVQQVATRIPIIAGQQQQVALRFLVLAQRVQLIASRLRLFGLVSSSFSLRLLLAGQQQQQQILGRMHLLAIRLQSLSSRLRLLDSGMRLLAVRVGLATSYQRDSVTRLHLQAIGQSLALLLLRARLSALSWQSLGGRLRLASLAQVQVLITRMRVRGDRSRDVGERIRLSSLFLSALASRIRMQGVEEKDAVGRLTLLAHTLSGLGMRFLLHGVTTSSSNVFLRLLLQLSGLRLFSSRLRVQARQYATFHCRVPLAGQYGWYLTTRVGIKALPAMFTVGSWSSAPSAFLTGTVAPQMLLDSSPPFRINGVVLDRPTSVTVPLQSTMQVLPAGSTWTLVFVFPSPTTQAQLVEGAIVTFSFVGVAGRRYVGRVRLTVTIQGDTTLVQVTTLYPLLPDS